MYLFEICRTFYSYQLLGVKPVLYVHSLLFTCSVMSDSSQPHGPQHARPPCPSPTPRVHSNSSPLSCDAILCHPLLLLPSIFPSIRVFSNESALRMRWPKYWSFSFNISPSNKHPALISFRMDWWISLQLQENIEICIYFLKKKVYISGWHLLIR